MFYFDILIERDLPPVKLSFPSLRTALRYYEFVVRAVESATRYS